MSENQNLKDRLSWWEYECYLRDIDFAIIGGGIVGLSTAIELKLTEPNSKILVVDKKSSPLGASTKNAGFACFGSISEIYDDFLSYGKETCQKLIQMRWNGLGIMKSRIPLEKMKYGATPGAEIFESADEQSFYEDKISWANSFVSKIVEDDECFTANQGKFGFQIVNKFEGSLNPQLMMNELELLARKMGVLFLTGVDVSHIDYNEKKIDTNLGKMSFNKLIICTNGFSRGLLPQKDVKPARNQVLLTNKIPGLNLTHCFHMNKGYIYFRSYEGRLLIGGARGLDLEGETTEELSTTELITSHLRDIIQNRILLNQSFNIEHTWSGILGVGESKMPLVEKVNDDVLVAVRMGGMGVAVGSFIGRVAASMMLQLNNRAQQLYVS